MEKFSVLNTFNISALTIKGKTLPIQVFSKTRSNPRLKVIEVPQRSLINTPIRHTHTDIASPNQLPLKIHCRSLSKKKHNQSTSKNHIGKIVLLETFEIESGPAIYKHLTNNAHIVPNSSNLNPIRVNTANKEKVNNRTPMKIRPRIFSPLLGRIKVKTVNETVVQALQKTNGFMCKETDEDGMFKYFLGKGNNVEVVKTVMKSRHRWKRVFSAKSANFCWTALKKLSIIEDLPSCEKQETEIIRSVSEHPLIIPQEFSCHIVPAQIITPIKTRMYNKLPGNSELTNKKLLFSNMFSYYTNQGVNPFSKIPVTYHISSGLQDPVFQDFLADFKNIAQKNSKNIWIVKPGENTNRGIGIRVFDSIEPISKYIHQLQDSNRTFIIQKYIENPLLFKMRKFDIRCYGLVTSFQNNIQGFFYKDGYLRTAAEEFSLKNVQNKFIHLTNDAVQKHSEKYGKYEDGNKLSYLEFQEYLNSIQSKINFFYCILPKIKEMVRDTIAATYLKLNPLRKIQSFEVLGYDFMVDQDLQVWLIEVNTNPCLELSSPYLETLIPKMLDSALSLTVDQVYPTNILSENNFEMIFNEAACLLLNNPNFTYVLIYNEYLRVSCKPNTLVFVSYKNC